MLNDTTNRGNAVAASTCWFHCCAGGAAEVELCCAACLCGKGHLHAWGWGAGLGCLPQPHTGRACVGDTGGCCTSSHNCLGGRGKQGKCRFYLRQFWVAAPMERPVGWWRGTCLLLLGHSAGGPRWCNVATTDIMYVCMYRTHLHGTRRGVETCLAAAHGVVCGMPVSVPPRTCRSSRQYSSVAGSRCAVLCCAVETDLPCHTPKPVGPPADP